MKDWPFDPEDAVQIHPRATPAQDTQEQLLRLTPRIVEALKKLAEISKECPGLEIVVRARQTDRGP